MKYKPQDEEYKHLVQPHEASLDVELLQPLQSHQVYSHDKPELQKKMSV